ncbi:MAG TPA: hypothetical protein VNI77_06755 [Nitrososphaera sp.]|nr:hypothetical protein [Nitrososphaera sp.]
MKIRPYAGILAVAFVAAVAAPAVPLAGSALAVFHEDSLGSSNNTTSGGGMSSHATNSQTQADTAATVDDDNNNNRVEVGRGSNLTVQYYTYSPQTIEINAGESVTWYADSEFMDIHTVTFVRDDSIISDAILPFTIPEGANFELTEPFNLGEPVIIETPQGSGIIVALNKDVFYPAVVDSDNRTTFPNATETMEYTMDGTERALNSGIIMPPAPSIMSAGEEALLDAAENITESPANNAVDSTAEGGDAEGAALEPPFPFVNEFTVTFERPGTYPYFCGIHPWMTGQVVVVPGGDGNNGNNSE